MSELLIVLPLCTCLILIDPVYPIMTLRDYSQLIFLPYIKHMLQEVVCVNVVWDIYKNSLMAQTRQDSGSSNHIWVDNTGKTPANWKNFLRYDANNDNFFKLLISVIHEFESPAQKQVVRTHGPNAVSSPIAETSRLFCRYSTPVTCFSLISLWLQ